MIVLGMIGLTLAAILVLHGVAQGQTEKIASNGAPIVPPAVKTETVSEIVSRFSRRFGVEEALIHAHIQVESSGNPNATNPSDPSYGLMGVTPRLAQDYGFVSDWRNVTAAEIAKLKDPAINIEIGSRFLSYLHRKYPFDVATQMYNCGEHGYNTNGVRVPEYLSRVRRWYDEFRTT